MPWPRGVPQSADSNAKRSLATKGIPKSAEVRAARIGRVRSTLDLEKRARTRADQWRQTPTDSELKMSAMLQEGGIRFRAQVAIYIYVVDFLIWPNIVLEVDGRIHRFVERQQMDAVKDEVLKGLGFIVIHVKAEDLDA